jgi:oxalate decarboxylase
MQDARIGAGIEGHRLTISKHTTNTARSLTMITRTKLANRRDILSALGLGAAGLAASRSLAAEGAKDGHAAGRDVAPASEFLPTIPRKTGDATAFTASLDGAPIKATSGGWAREITMRSLPIATDIAGARLFLNPGGAREMHWHNAAEWAYILDGHCQITVVDPEGKVEVANYAAGDLWFFPKGHAHAIQCLGSEDCHAILAFDDGLYSEHGTFGISDWMSRLDSTMLSQALGVSKDAIEKFPKAETYIMQGKVLALDGPQAHAAKELDHPHSHRYRLMTQKPTIRTPGGELYIASSREFPLSETMSGWVLKLKPGAMHEPHWHPNANELHYVAKGRVRLTLFEPEKRMAVTEIAAGDCAYIPRNSGHSVLNIGNVDAEIVGVLDSGTYLESSLYDWVVKAPRHLLANNFGIPEGDLPAFRKQRAVIVGAA